MPTDPEDNGEGHVDGFDESEEIDESDLVTITDEDGRELECAILGILEHEDQEYALLAPLDQLQAEDGDEIEMFIFTYGLDEDGNQTFGYIDDDATYGAVRAEFALLVDQDDDEDEDE
ncbi:MAG: DUF1292 domain-containing protein [Alphaproteobacteria bacterium]|nr:DUF1292 domain-containing protein [Alphaproteobacteria bacterium]MCB9695272.1 DUF1292 domain-containing protein [Alphaproteobacteria bacterium]